MCSTSFLESEGKKEISFYKLPGGIVWSGLAIYDTMQYVSSKIMTIYVGPAASAGSLLLTAGEKGLRYFANSKLWFINQMVAIRSSSKHRDSNKRN